MKCYGTDMKFGTGSIRQAVTDATQKLAATASDTRTSILTVAVVAGLALLVAGLALLLTVRARRAAA